MYMILKIKSRGFAAAGLKGIFISTVSEYRSQLSSLYTGSLVFVQEPHRLPS